MTQTPVITPIVQPSWGNKNRPQKAHALLTTLRQFSTFDVMQYTEWLWKQHLLLPAGAATNPEQVDYLAKSVRTALI